MSHHHTLRRAMLIAVVTLTMTTVPALAQEAEEATPEPNWESALGLSYVGTSGNTDTSTLGLDLGAERKPTPWGLDLTASFTRAEDRGVRTAERYFVGGRGLRQLSERISLFAGLSWQRDPFAGFDNRWIAEAGAEYIAVQKKRHAVTFDLGATWTSEDQIRTDGVTGEPSTQTVDWIGAIAGVRWEWKINPNASFSQRVAYFPNFDESADWRLNSDSVLKASLTKMLALQLSYLVQYRNLPIDDLEKTDTTTKMSVVLNF